VVSSRNGPWPRYLRVDYIGKCLTEITDATTLGSYPTEQVEGN
jgi:hypothetical protein